MSERPVDFDRLRYMRCWTCAHEWEVDAAWLARFDTGDEPCPKCGTDCTSEHRPDFWVRPQNPARYDDTVRAWYWYHSSTHAVWPDRDFDPAAQLTDETKRRMEHDGLTPGAVERWAARQKSKALHIGTYEAAIENMLRRMNDQRDAASQFYLYRVQLRSDCVIEPGIHPELPGLMGDVELSADAQKANVFRYVNVCEDVSSVSLAIEISAVWKVQSIPIPLPVDADDPGLREATARLLAAADRPIEQTRPEDDDDTGPLERLRRRHTPQTPLASEAGRLRHETADLLPLLQRQQLRVEFDEAGFAGDPSAYPAKLIGLVRLVSDPQAILDALNQQPGHLVPPAPGEQSFLMQER
ncbi:hypothetical protein [Millisia brevis]|uniref:hypothetical protein n=1 Tax=Millisia brevis TaxID=264148 RepID=UPI00082A44EC|nr:hypothetical protein [Millisia brevis]